MTGPVVVAYDGSPDADRAVRTVAEVFQGRPVVIATAWVKVTRLGPSEIWTTASDPETDAAGAKRADETAERGVQLARDCGVADASKRVESEGGRLWQSILDVADDVEASAIIVGATGHSAIAEKMLGSVSRAIAQHAERPVLIVPRQGS